MGNLVKYLNKTPKLFLSLEDEMCSLSTYVCLIESLASNQSNVSCSELCMHAAPQLAFPLQVLNDSPPKTKVMAQEVRLLHALTVDY